MHRVAGAEFSLAKDGQVKSAPSALQKFLDDIGPAKSDAQLKAGHPRLCDYDMHRPDLKPVADIDLRIEHALRREVFAEHTPGQILRRKFSTPIGVVLGRININGF